jgi:hypothetical protein
MSSDQASTAATFDCPSCGVQSAGGFCRNCGEKKAGPRDFTLRHYFDVVINFLTHFDAKGYRTLWLVVSKPGYLSTEYLRGSRVRYLKPFPLFVALSVVYFISATLFTISTFSTPLAVQLRMNDYYPGYAQAQVDKKMNRENISYEALEAKYNDRAGVLSRTLVFLFIPVFAAMFYALFFRKRKHFVEHVVVATHFWSFNLILLGVILPLVTLPLVLLFGQRSVSAVYATHDEVLSAVLQICFAVYLFFMLRRVYSIGDWYAAVISLAIAWSMFHILWLYRFILFLITMRLV